MRPNISNCHALPGTLIVFEGADGSGKTTQIKSLVRLLQNEGHEVTVSSWKSAPILWDFLRINDALKKSDDRILPETGLFLQSADLLYRLEREVIPALKRNHIVIMDRGIHTLIVRGLMIGMSDTQVRTGLLWWRNSIYKELFDKAITVYLSIPGDESLKRIQKRALKERRDADMKRKKKEEGTLLALHFIDTLVYSADGKKMTRNDKKTFVHKTQSQIIDTYNKVFENESRPYIELDGTLSIKETTKNLQWKVIDMILS
jgi:thymidylate kinase